MSKIAFLLLVICVQPAVTAAKYLSCPLGWVTYEESSYCYRVGPTPTAKWNEARKTCLSMGGDLVKIRSARENRYVALLACTYSGRSSNMWIGLVRDSNNAFNWGDGSFLIGQYSNWQPGEPNSNQEKCGMMYLNTMEWNDEDCIYSSAFTYVCEKQKS